jgi:cytochrome c-type biogenesis protein CcmH
MVLWEFWVAAVVITALVLVLILLALRSRQGAEPSAEHDLQVYRDQLKEVERDLSRGMIGAEEANRLRTEVARRILEADRAATAEAKAGTAPRWATWAAAVAVVVLGLGALGLYDRLGAPGYADLPMAERLAASRQAMKDRPSQAQMEAAAPKQPEVKADPKYRELIAKLRAAVEKRPNDLQGQRLLAANEARLGHYDAAWKAQAQVIRLEGDKATAEDYAWQGELMVLAAGGRVSPEADRPLARAMKLDPKNGTARFFTGLLYEQVGRPDLTFQLWQPLLAQGPQDAPWIAAIRAQIEAVAEAAGINYQLPPAPGAKGPSAGDIAAASKMSPAQRQQMIRGMVEGLATRLNAKGGTPAEWARLITAYGVLGEKAKAQAAWTKAQTAFVGQPDKLAPIRAAAEKAGVGG